MHIKLFFSAILIGTVCALFNAQSAFATPKQISLIVMPHPDDESQAWSLIENSTTNYKVFAYMTTGDETGFCRPAAYSSALRVDLGEIAPHFEPTGKWTSSCKESRIGSTLNFLNAMSTKDSSIPGGFEYSSFSTIELPKNGYSPERKDDGVTIDSPNVRVYTATNGMGKVLFFDLGDGDLTADEVTWAITSIQSNRSILELPSDLPFYNAIGPFANSGYKSCAVYAHVDHKAIHTALFHKDFKLSGYQTAATCATDPDVVRTKKVTNDSWTNIWGVDSASYQRIGFGQQYYGWLNSGTRGWNVPFGDRQDTPFPLMQRQSFWQKY